MCIKHKFLVLTAVLTAFCSTALFGQEKSAQEPGRYLISIYHVAPGQHLEFLKWMAGQEAIAKEAGASPTQWYAHLDGDSWDYLVISKQFGDARDKEIESKMQELSKKKGVPSGMAAALKFRQFMASHTDTYVVGPLTAAEIVKMAEK